MTLVTGRKTSQQRSGAAAEDLALSYLQAKGLTLIERNFRVRGGTGGEIDLVMQDGATLVFVEVRARSEGAQAGRFGGAVASLTAGKLSRLQRAVEHYLARVSGTRQLPLCRVDAVLMDGDATGTSAPQWLKNILG